MIFSSAVNSGNNWWNWNTKPRCWLRKSDSFFFDRRLVSMPSTITVPVSGLSNVPIICNRVVLPAPEGPTILTTSPLSICRSMPFSTSNEPKLFLIFLISIIYCILFLLFSTPFLPLSYALATPFLRLFYAFATIFSYSVYIFYFFFSCIQRRMVS